MKLLKSITQTLKPLVTRRNIWIQRSHRVLLDRWDHQMPFDLHYVLPHLLLRRQPITMVQVGACDGLLDDPVEPYIRSGRIKGLLVEPQPEAFATLQERYKDRSDIMLANCAVTASDGELKMYRIRSSHLHLAPAYAFGMASTKPDTLVAELKRWTPDPWAAIETIHVPAVTWKTLFETHSVDQIDLVQLDTEGLESELLDAFPFESFQPILLHFEWVHLEEPVLGNLFNRLMDLGYSLHLAGIDAVAYRRDKAEAITILPAGLAK